jgi:hypothetical protein
MPQQHQPTGPHQLPGPQGQPGPHQPPGSQGQPGPQGQQAPHPQSDDPYKPFVTAGQISGPKTPPAHRQQELWNTVFGENYREIDEYEEEEERGRPIWLFALIGTVLVALVGGLIWAFAFGPLSSGSGSDDSTSPASKPVASKPATATKPQSQIPALPKFKGTASPVSGVVTDETAKITLPRLGGPWQLDLRTQHIQTTYGFTTRQYVPAGMTNTGKPQFAQVMSGALPQALAAKFTTPDNLTPVISAVAFQARQKLFPKGNKSTKIAQQNISKNGITGRLIAYKVSDDAGSSTVVIAALNAGADLPSIVYMQVPDVKDSLLPDINTIFKSIKKA